MSVREAAMALLLAWDANDASAHHKALVALRAALADEVDQVSVPRECLIRWRTAFPVLGGMLSRIGLEKGAEIANAVPCEIDAMLAAAEKEPKS